MSLDIPEVSLPNRLLLRAMRLLLNLGKKRPRREDYISSATKKYLRPRTTFALYDDEEDYYDDDDTEEDEDDVIKYSASWKKYGGGKLTSAERAAVEKDYGPGGLWEFKPRVTLPASMYLPSGLRVRKPKGTELQFGPGDPYRITADFDPKTIRVVKPIPRRWSTQPKMQPVQADPFARKYKLAGQTYNYLTGQWEHIVVPTSQWEMRDPRAQAQKKAYETVLSPLLQNIPEGQIGKPGTYTVPAWSRPKTRYQTVVSPLIAMAGRGITDPTKLTARDLQAVGVPIAKEKKTTGATKKTAAKT